MFSSAAVAYHYFLFQLHDFLHRAISFPLLTNPKRIRTVFFFLIRRNREWVYREERLKQSMRFLNTLNYSLKIYRRRFSGCHVYLQVSRSISQRARIVNRKCVLCNKSSPRDNAFRIYIKTIRNCSFDVVTEDIIT